MCLSSERGIQVEQHHTMIGKLAARDSREMIMESTFQMQRAVVGYHEYES